MKSGAAVMVLAATALVSVCSGFTLPTEASASSALTPGALTEINPWNRSEAARILEMKRREMKEPNTTKVFAGRSPGGFQRAARAQLKKFFDETTAFKAARAAGTDVPESLADVNRTFNNYTPSDPAEPSMTEVDPALSAAEATPSSMIEHEALATSATESEPDAQGESETGAPSSSVGEKSGEEEEPSTRSDANKEWIQAMQDRVSRATSLTVAVKEELKEERILIPEVEKKLKLVQGEHAKLMAAEAAAKKVAEAQALAKDAKEAETSKNTTGSPAGTPGSPSSAPSSAAGSPQASVQPSSEPNGTEKLQKAMDGLADKLTKGRTTLSKAVEPDDTEIFVGNKELFNGFQGKNRALMIGGEVYGIDHTAWTVHHRVFLKNSVSKHYDSGETVRLLKAAYCPSFGCDTCESFKKDQCDEGRVFNDPKIECGPAGCKEETCCQGCDAKKEYIEQLQQQLRKADPAVQEFVEEVEKIYVEKIKTGTLNENSLQLRPFMNEVEHLNHLKASIQDHNRSCPHKIDIKAFQPVYMEKQIDDMVKYGMLESIHFHAVNFEKAYTHICTHKFSVEQVIVAAKIALGSGLDTMSANHASNGSVAPLGSSVLLQSSSDKWGWWPGYPVAYFVCLYWAMKAYLVTCQVSIGAALLKEALWILCAFLLR